MTSLQWYPVDAGLFVSGAMDGVIKVWDTSRFEPAMAFELGERVYAARMPPPDADDGGGRRGRRGAGAKRGRTHCLIAAGTDGTRVRLCDLTVGCAPVVRFEGR